MLSFTLTLVETTPPLTGAVSGGNDTKESPLQYFLCIKGFRLQEFGLPITLQRGIRDTQ